MRKPNLRKTQIYQQQIQMLGPKKNKAPIIAAIAEALPVLQYLISSSFMAIKNTHNPHFLHTVIVE